jgi:hypothetical protein
VLVHRVRDSEIGVCAPAEDDLVAIEAPCQLCRVVESRSVRDTHIFDIHTIGWPPSFIPSMVYPKLCQSVTNFCPLNTETTFATTNVGMAGGFCSNRNPAAGGMTCSSICSSEASWNTALHGA